MTNRLLWVLLLSQTLTSAAQSCTGGIPSGMTPGKEIVRHLQVKDGDRRLGVYKREYRITLPMNYTGAQKVPLLMYFHGWGDNYTCIDDACSLSHKGSARGYIIVKPKGMEDGGPSSWNLGTGPHTDTCVHKDVDKYHYKSCNKTGVTSICNCGTCYDDFLFVADLLQTLATQFCLDTNQIYGTGASFGALFNYYTAVALASGSNMLRFRAILPWYGAFYQHTQVVPTREKGPSVFHFHGSKDTEVPPNGGESEDGYLYIPVDKSLRAYAESYGCETHPGHLVTPFDGRGTLLGCKEWRACKGNLRIVRCTWNEEHGFWPTYAEEMMFWFLASSLGTRSVESETIFF